MLAQLAREVPERTDMLYEPKWDGFRCLVFRDGDELYLQSRNAKPLARYFPELLEPLRAQLPPRCVLDGELVVVTERGLDFDALQLRQHPADSRVQRLAAEIPATYIAFDVLAVGDDSLMDRPMGERRARLEELLGDAVPPLVLTPATTDPALAREWFVGFESAGFDGIVGKPLDGVYTPGRRTLIKVKHERTCDCAVAGFRIHKDGEGVGSLLLGLFDETGALHHVGVAAGIAAPARRAMLGELEPLRANALDGHPWREWAEFQARAAQGNPTRMPGGASRWNAAKDLSWEPLRVELVAEVAYEGLLNGRFRHNAHFRRFRADRDPSSCTYAQLEVPPAAARAAFGALAGPGGSAGAS
jgi:ATP-dependent DNA ligase